MALAEQKARTFRRAVVNKAKNYTPIETKVREATSNDPWGPETNLLNEIADASHNVVAFGEIMNVLWKRINDDGKNWRHVMKSLAVLECLVKSGSEKCAEQCKKNIYAIETLSTFQHIDKDGKDMGHVVREKAKNLVLLLKDDERLRSERLKASALREKMGATTVWSISSNGQRNVASGTAWRPTFPPDSVPEHRAHRSNTGSSSGGADSAFIATEMKNALPSDATEEELQLQLALALSKEDAEKEESQRKNADIRLQLALEESKKEEKRKISTGNADFLSLNMASGIAQPTLKEQAQKARSMSSQAMVSQSSSFDPWGHKGSDATNDPFGGPAVDSFGVVGLQPSMSPYPNFFTGSGSEMPAPLLPSSNSNSSHDANISQSDGLCQFERPKSPSEQAAETFLGDHAKLVNFDNLITPTRSAINGQIFPSANPFSGSIPARGNPFQPPKAPQPSINELRTKQGTFSNSASNSSGPFDLLGQQPQPVFTPFSQVSQPGTMQYQQPPSIPEFPSGFANHSAPPMESYQNTNNDLNPFR
ncbi:epsin-2-like [Symsagittifera roscoffensis]|uniref:epsin-2-like n=1 Tax=Symsagittifera roscoffensis TaxID=84072 RepID=UPI00307B96A4